MAVGIKNNTVQLHHRVNWHLTTELKQCTGTWTLTRETGRFLVLAVLMLATNVIYGRMLILNVQVILQVIQYLTSNRL